MNERSKRAKLNIVVSLLCQVISVICGFVVPKLMLDEFGSEIYGATSSIAQFLAYITLLEGGIGGVARAALYKPLAENDVEKISAIVLEIKRFFRVIAYVFLVYVVVLACFFHQLSGIDSLNWISTFLLVIVISISTFGQYFIGISYSVLLQADQKNYITNFISILATVANTILVISLTVAGCNIILVKFASSCVFVMRPIVLWLYVKKNYGLVKISSDRVYLKQKRAGLSQHIAFFLHSNTDVVVLTWLSNLSVVSVYSVYNMVVSQIQNLTSSFSTGMEALFGDMLSKNEQNQLQKVFGYYDTLISTVSTILFASTAVLIVPFVRLYTRGVTDANYIAPVFAVLLVLASYVYCLRMPYHSMTIAAGHFRETQWAAYGEVIINVVLSILLVKFYDLVGVAIGTVIATSFRFVYYAIYLSKHIFERRIILAIKRTFINAVQFVTIYTVGSIIISAIDIHSYIMWVACGAIVFTLASLVTLAVNSFFYHSDFMLAFSNVSNKLIWRKNK